MSKNSQITPNIYVDDCWRLMFWSKRGQITFRSLINQKDMKALNWKSPSNIQRIYFHRPLCLGNHRVIMMIKYLSSVSARCNPQIRCETSWWSQHCRWTPPPTATTTTRCSTSTRWSTTPGRTFARTLRSRRWAKPTKHCTILSNIVKHGLHVCSLPQPAGHQPPQLG